MSDKFENGSRRRGSPSLFGPIVLIALGVYFLLSNMGMLPSFGAWNWPAVLTLWPLWLIFLGINLIVRQAPRPFGAFLSGLVGLTAVALLGYVLLFSEGNQFLASLGVENTQEGQQEFVSYRGEEVQEAEIEIDFGLVPARLGVLEDSPDLFAGEVAYLGTLDFRADQEDGVASIYLNTNSSGWGWIFNPANWAGNESLPSWDLGINGRVPVDLRLDLSTGAVDLDLDGLTLTHVNIDGGTGSVDLALPGGNYDLVYEVGVGATEIWLGDNGRQEIELDGGTGSLTIYLPAEMEARIEVNDGTGSFSLDRDRFTQISGTEPDDGVWETANYEDAPNRVDMIIDVGTGSVRVREP